MIAVLSGQELWKQLSRLLDGGGVLGRCADSGQRTALTLRAQGLCWRFAREAPCGQPLKGADIAVKVDEQYRHVTESKNMKMSEFGEG